MLSAAAVLTAIAIEVAAVLLSTSSVAAIARINPQPAGTTERVVALAVVAAVTDGAVSGSLSSLKRETTSRE